MTSARPVDVERFWSDYAPTFDQEPDHGLADPDVRRAWATALERWLPATPQRIADLGCGTGSLSLLLAERGHEVVGLDLAGGMVREASRKRSVGNSDVTFVRADVSDPPLMPGSIDVVICRHVLWALPDPQLTLRRWRKLLSPSGRLIAIEGRWFEPKDDAPRTRWDGGVSASRLSPALASLFGELQHESLGERAALWGRPVDDERYALVATEPR